MPRKRTSLTSSTARGYGEEHKKLRARVKRAVDAGGVSCCICGLPIPPFSDFHLDHTPDRTSYRGAAHPWCNTSDANRRRAGRARATRAPALSAPAQNGNQDLTPLADIPTSERVARGRWSRQWYQ
jgi:hypothetical protein